MAQDKSEKDDLKAREYRDEKGQIHHHTHAYMEQHRQEGRGERGQSGRAKSAGGRSASGGRPEKTARVSGAKTTADPGEIRTWAESHGGKPAAVKRTHQGGDVGIIRIMFPDAPNSEHDALEEISWDEFFQEFDKRELALLYDDDTLFNKIIGRDTAEKRARGDHDAAR